MIPLKATIAARSSGFCRPRPGTTHTRARESRARPPTVPAGRPARVAFLALRRRRPTKPIWQCGGLIAPSVDWRARGWSTGAEYQRRIRQHWWSPHPPAMNWTESGLRDSMRRIHDVRLPRHAGVHAGCCLGGG